MQISDAPSSAFLRELQHTRRCDAITQDLSEVRANYKRYVDQYDPTGSAWTRIMTCQDTESDARFADDAVRHHRVFTNKHILAGLSLARRIQFYTIDKSERTLAALGLFAIVGGDAKYGKGRG